LVFTHHYYTSKNRFVQPTYLFWLQSRYYQDIIKIITNRKFFRNDIIPRICDVIVKSQEDTTPERSTAGFHGIWEISITYIHISSSNEGVSPTREPRGG